MNTRNTRPEFIGLRLTTAERKMLDDVVIATGASTLSEALRLALREAAEARDLILKPRRIRRDAVRKG